MRCDRQERPCNASLKWRRYRPSNTGTRRNWHPDSCGRAFGHQKWKHPEEIRFLKTTDMLVKMIAELDGAAPWKDIRKTPEGIEDEVINNFSASRQKDNYHSTIDAFYYSGNEHGIRKLV